MVPTPVILGLTLCDYVIVEQRTGKVSLVGSFSSIKVDRFPARVLPFSAFAIVTDGTGDATIKLVAVREETQEEVDAWEFEHHFPDRLAEVRIHFRLTQCELPAAGWYQFTLLVDNQYVAQRRVRAYQAED